MLFASNKNVYGFSVAPFNGVDSLMYCFHIGAANGAGILKGIQIGFVNIAKYNNYPIGVINIIKVGHMEAGMAIDGMSNLMAIFRSVGRYLYGVMSVGYSFASSIDHITLELGWFSNLKGKMEYNL